MLRYRNRSQLALWITAFGGEGGGSVCKGLAMMAWRLTLDPSPHTKAGWGCAHCTTLVLGGRDLHNSGDSWGQCSWNSELRFQWGTLSQKVRWRGDWRHSSVIPWPPNMPPKSHRYLHTHDKTHGKAVYFGHLRAILNYQLAFHSCIC